MLAAWGWWSLRRAMVPSEHFNQLRKRVVDIENRLSKVADIHDWHRLDRRFVELRVKVDGLDSSSRAIRESVRRIEDFLLQNSHKNGN